MDSESDASSKTGGGEDENVALLMGMAERIQSMAPDKKKGGGMLQQQQESYKEKMQRFKEERNGRLSGLRSQHRHIMDMVSMYLGVEPDTIQTWIIDRQEYCDYMESFAQEKGGKGLVFSYQDCPPPDLETGRFDPSMPPDTVLKGFVVSNCLQGDVRGKSVAVWRMKNTHALENKALMEEVFYSILDCDASPTASAQGALYGLLSNVYHPSITAYTEWGDLKKTALGLARKQTFLGDLNSFVTFMGATKLDLESLVIFPIDRAMYRQHLATIDDVMATSKNRPVVLEIEKTVRIWITLMQKTLTESQQLRRENDTVGPLLELEYWRRQLAKFNSIVEHLKSAECRMHIHCLMLCKSKILKKWRRVDNETTDASNEAKDNVKYLYSLQKFCEPLYRTDPTTMAEHLPSLLYSIRMVFTTSRFFNTTERVSALLVKMTNQMVNTCRRYLTDNGSLTIWEQAKHNVLRKSEVCLNLYTRYYQSFQRIKRDMAAAEEPPFDCSEMYVFGKFETFKKRLEEIVDVLETTLMYSILQSSTIEGIDEFADRFKILFKNISTQPYDPLNHRKSYFNKDYETFKQGVLDIEYMLHDFVIKTLNQQPNVNSLIQMAQRFEKLGLECLDIEERFLDILLKLQEEIENTRDSYNEQRQNPALSRNAPPVSGRIMWVRQLYKRMEMPMDIVKSHEWVIKHKRSQKCIQLYNSLACVFLHYEQLHHEAWVAHVGQVRLGLSLPLLVKHTKTKMNVVNFDSYIFETISEAEHMWRLGLDVPDIARILVFNKAKIIESYETVADLVKRNNSVRKAIPRLFILLMRALLLKLDRVFQPGFSAITWTSLAIPKFCEDIDKTLILVDEFTKKVNDLKEARIIEVFDGISKVKLIQLPEAPLDSKDLLKINKEYVEKMGNELETRSASVEQATIELINKFMDTIEQPEVQAIKYKWLDPEEAAKPVGSQMRINAPEEAAFKEVDPTSLNDLTTIHHDCLEMFSFFNSKLIEALLRCTKVSLETLKKRSTGFSNVGGTFMDKPLFTTYLELHIPNSIINPSINDIQTDYAELVSNILNVHKYITVWGQRPSMSTIDKAKKTLNFESDDGNDGMETYFKSIAEQKDIVRIIISLQGAIIILLKPDISKLCETYLEWNYLWAENREQQIIDFIAKKPLIEEVKDEFLLYDQRAADIHKLPEYHDIGTIRVFTERFKMALLVESNAWKYCLGKHLSNTYKDKLVEMVDFITQRMKVLVRKIKDLDDVRLAMACLEEVRQNFIQMDMDLIAMEAAYALFAKFNVDIPQDDIDRVNTLRYNFTNMLEAAKEVQETVVKVQGPFQKELINGVAKFNAEVEKFDVDFEEKGPMVEGLSAKEASDRVLLFQARFDDLWSRFEVYSSGERLFGMEVKDYPILHKRKKEFNLLNKLYGLYLEVNHKIDGYFELLWCDVDTDVIITELTDFQNRCRKLPKAMKDWPAFIDLKQKIDDFNETCPLLEMMANKAMKDRHWKRISALTATNLDIEDEAFSLKMVMEAPLLNFKDDVEDICISAVKEKDIEAKLKQVIADWSVVDLQFGVFKTRGELLLKGGEVADVISILEDSLMVLNSLLSNRYNAPFKKDIQLWLNKLVTTSEVLEKWLVVQNLFMYLEAVFVGGDISKQMPAEAKRFSGIDKTWVKIMARAHELLNVVECCAGDETMSQLLPHLLEQLETCQKSLTGYLEQKRLQFPRFFFISDPGLLEILGQASDVHSIQSHLPSLFDAIDKVEFDEKYPDRIVGMKAAAGEIVPLDRYVSCHGGVEHWLTLLLSSMRDTVRNVCAQIAMSLNDPEFDIIAGYHKFPAQAGLIGIQILWTLETEQALALCKYDRTIMRTTNQRFLDLLNSLIDITTRELSKMERVQIETMITIHVHQRDIFDDMCKLKIRNPIDFEWQKQARFYYEEDTDDIWVKITDVDFLYQCEYLGVTDRLAITPLTDRCYITLSQAMGMNMGGAPAGPAGTGKTETTKDMGRALGKLVVVFNCSDQMDFRGLARIYKGLAQSGSWGCFDEFNRIELPVLSVAAQQINIVLTARKEKKATFVFNDGDIVSLNPEFGIFLTMNPGYAGRQELPENLKIMFRTVSMMVPDRGIIMRVKLASCGFKDNVPLSRKFFTLYKLCEEQLSKQVHYDFGLRNILSVLRTLGAQKRSNPQETEETIVMRVLREMNVSKLVDEDEPLFLSLIDDMFPGLKLSLSVNKELQRTISNQTSQMGLTNHAEWNLKVVQLYDTSLVRHGLMVLGPTGAGKTKCIHTLMRCITEMGKPHKEMRMNPKAITAPQMFGRLDVATNDWTDGIFSTLWRKTLKIKKTEYVWLVLDGPVDAVWIENLNSVLDDNKTLTLANGDRIVMAENSKLMFEPDNVDNASPATISRMGMVFMSASVLKWGPILDGWLKKRNNHEADVLKRLFDLIYDDLHTYVQTRLKAKMAILEALYIRQCCDLLSGLLDSEEPRLLPDKHIERIFLFSLMWSLGAVLELDCRSKMEDFVLKHPSKLVWPKLNENESVFEYTVSEDGKWAHWSEFIVDYIYPDDSVPEYTSILVPNVDNVRTAFLIQTIAKQKKAVLLIGEQGTAKTVMIKGFMGTFDSEVHLVKSFNFSSATTPNMFQRIIESYVDKRVGTSYGPPAGKEMTVFIDDINMPLVNEWGDQITNEIVRQLMEAGGFFSLDRPGDFSTILDVHLMGAMIHPGGGRNDIPPRLKRQFCVFNCTIPSNTSMDKIFTVIGEGYFCSTRFNENIVEFLPNLISLTRIVWQQTKAKMLPTPAKFHYVFNLRDLSRIWQGLLTIQGPECQDETMLLKLWKHEFARVIADRFTDEKDREWFSANLRRTSEDQLKENFSMFPEVDTYFVDFLRDPPEPTGEETEDVSLEPPKIYEEIPSYEFVTEKVFAFMDQYNEQVRGALMDLVFFRDALVHLMIISRIVRMQRGNALLVGVGGSGKQSLTRLASFMAGYRIFQIQLTRSYNQSNLQDDLKFLYRVAGLEGHGMTFVFTDNEVKDENFLEYINNVLSSGEIANLFAKDELDEIQSALIGVMKKVAPKIIPTNDNLYDFFISRARSNLHVVLCFSPVGEKFRSRSLKFPGLISGCTIDWFSRWPNDALVAVSTHILKSFEIVCSPQIKTAIIGIMADVQDSVVETCVSYYDKYRRQTYVTPKSYLSFLDGYTKIYVDKKAGIDEMAQKMIVGLDKLVEAQVSVDILRKELVLKEKDIIIATKKAEEVLEVVLVAAEAAQKVKGEAMATKERAEALVTVISADQKVAEAKLEAAKPALEAAEAALQTIKASDIATVRKLGKPPYLITLIMDAVLIYFKKKIDPVKPDPDKQFLMPAWTESLKVMADSKFLSNLQQYPKDTINAEMIDLLVPYFNFPQYTFEAAKSACGNVAGLIQWTLAMTSFYSVNKEVLPLKANLDIQRARYNKAAEELDAAMTLLRAKEEEVAACQKQYDEAMALKTAVQEDATKCKNKMDAASALINGLAGERVRWTEACAQFKSEIDRLVGDVLLLTGFLSYTGPFNQEYRTMMQKKWLNDLVRLKIPVSQNLNITDSLVDTATIGEWNLQGLPTDDLSIQNGIIVTKASRFPLLIDPQNQGIAWIKEKEKINDLIVTTLNHKYFRQHLEDCVSLGRPMLIEDILEELDPVLDNVLEKNYIKIGTSYKVKVGDKEVDVNDDFRLYITTKLANPSYTPEVSARTSIIDFTVTIKGLEDQLLGRVILTEKRELETERTNLIKDVTANKRKMSELEANLLYKLSTTQGSLVDDETVIEVLNVTKNTAAEVQEKLTIARDTEIKINAAREEFRPVATRGSVLYFLIVSLTAVNCMYQTSLVQFLERFDISMARSDKTPITHRRINFIIEYLTYDIFKYISRGLYETHKYLFVLMMCLKIDLDREHITYDEMQNFIKGGAALDLNSVPPKPAKWITDMTWLNLVQLSSLRHFQHILTQVTNGEKTWKAWFDKDAPEETPMPDGYQSLDVWKRLLMVRSWCPDRTLAQSRKYISNSLGARFGEAVILNLELMHGESRALTPMVCFLSMGNDPTPNIESLAKKMEIPCKSISLGQGQEIHARKLVSESMERGSWVLLQNCHLGLEYMLEIYGLFLELEKTKDLHKDFRLWMTTEPHPKFSISLLQMCVKFTNEPPSGIKAGLLRTYSTMGQDMLDYSDSIYYLPLIYAISFLHTIVQERRKFGPLGWNIPYEFNSADWLASCMFVQNHLDDLDPKRGISWQTIRYMLGEVQYGGRVTDDYDKRLLNTFAKCWFSEVMFNEDFVFYKGYRIMKYKNQHEYIAEIEEMLTTDPPQAYGLHSNADITYQSNTVSTMLSTILSIQPKESSGGSGETRESVVARQAQDMLDKLPPNYDPYEVRERLKIMGILAPMNIFLRQEIDRMQKVIKLVRTTLRDLLLAVEGTIIMNEALRDALDNIFDARIPNVWKKSSWASATLGFWFTELLERNAQFSTWVYTGRPLTFWMTGFFNPQGFLTYMRQEVTRAHKGWALDGVSLHNTVSKLTQEEIKVAPVEGVYVYGLYLDGAGWDRRNSRLAESPQKVLYTMLPVVHMYAINSVAPKSSQLYMCPVYKKPNRTDLTYVTPLWLESVKNPDHWILRGVALLCDIK